MNDINSILGGAPAPSPKPAMPGGGGPMMQGPPSPGPGPQDAPGDQPEAGGDAGPGQPFVKQIVIAGLEMPGRETVSFVFLDGSRATETIPELVQMGVPQNLVKSVAAALTKVAEHVHQVNRGGGR